MRHTTPLHDPPAACHGLLPALSATSVTEGLSGVGSIRSPPRRCGRMPSSTPDFTRISGAQPGAGTSLDSKTGSDHAWLGKAMKKILFFVIEESPVGMWTTGRRNHKSLVHSTWKNNPMLRACRNGSRMRRTTTCTAAAAVIRSLTRFPDSDAHAHPRRRATDCPQPQLPQLPCD